MIYNNTGKRKKTAREYSVETEKLSVAYKAGQGERVYALKDVDLEIKKGESAAIVGESGCGKSTLANAFLNLLPRNTEIAGEARINGRTVTGKSNKQLREIRGLEAGIIFQDPGASLNPVFTVKQQIIEAMEAHFPEMKKKEKEEKGLKLLRETGITDPERVYNSYPHRLSGGQQQRVMIASALSCDPGILIADEPTTALDVTVQAMIIRLLKDLKKKRKLTLLLITHDLHLALELSGRLVVMYGGEIVEDGSIKEAKDAYHPYTRALFEIIPDLKSKKRNFKIIEGSVPDVRAVKDECGFADRCLYAKARCRKKRPEANKKKGHIYRCYYPLR
ncbi:MAG TPA: ABC transporter ATP-binding protein [Firmicutes bacterium]|nr:ABC transporter ATP-binding protein [Bacillota bacterium]